MQKEKIEKRCAGIAFPLANAGAQLHASAYCPPHFLRNTAPFLFEQLSGKGAGYSHAVYLRRAFFVRRGYDRTHPQAKYLKYKSWYLACPLSDEQLTSPALISYAAGICGAMRPFNSF